MMAKPLEIVITPEQREELEDARDHHPIPYIRERSAAILKIADGQSGLQVALNGLLKPRDPDTVYTWVRRYKTEGFEGLVIKAGRGRKPAFFEQYPDEKEAKVALLHEVRRDPVLFGYDRTRWTLPMIAQTCDWLHLKTEAGLSQVLTRLGSPGARCLRDFEDSPYPSANRRRPRLSPLDAARRGKWRDRRR